MYQVESVVLPATQDGVLHGYAQRISADLDEGASAYWLIDEAQLALDARLALFDEAQRSLDIQYFIWEDGISSRLLTHRLIAAADRGVRVRLLLDDLTMAMRDWEFVALDEHELIEVRTFNPWKRRSRLQRAFEFGARHDDLNHRMHVKTIVADGNFGMIGGRNVGDRYFGVYDAFVQNDLDVMTVGPMVSELAESFDLYWNSAQSYPITAVIRHARRYQPLSDFTLLLEREFLAGRDKLTTYPLQRADWRWFLDGLSRRYVSATGELSYDLPSLDNAERRRLYTDFKELLTTAQKRVVISTAYFIPDARLMTLLSSLLDRGVDVIVLTNSLATNNHLIAHAGYRQWRKRLLEIGVELYEMRADATSVAAYSLPPTRAGYLGLHTKATVVDDRWSFIGSPNVDPRSMLHNTEIGFFLDSAELNKRLAELLERDLQPENSWQVTLDENGREKWTNSDETVDRQPAMGFKQRFIEFLINLVPGAKGQA